MKKDDSIYLVDILESLKQVQRYLESKSVKDFEADPLLRDAVLMRLVVTGESAARLTGDFRTRHPDTE